uniref:Uncharacterized protein n=1 Tax=Ditylenchus dipsaci TaxID=166011 RepID=A0A915DDH3_9BILA
MEGAQIQTKAAYKEECKDRSESGRARAWAELKAAGEAGGVELEDYIAADQNLVTGGLLTLKKLQHPSQQLMSKKRTATLTWLKSKKRSQNSRRHKWGT